MQRQIQKMIPQHNRAKQWQKAIARLDMATAISQDPHAIEQQHGCAFSNTSHSQVH